MSPTHPKVTSDSEAPSKGNRGPAAAAANRDAILDAARSAFAVRGLSVPMTAIAHEAGVSQGVLYRHFPSRADLSLAIFEENVAKIVHAASQAPAPERQFGAAWQQMVNLTVSDVAFIEMAVQSTRDPRFDALTQNLQDFLDPLLRRAISAGEVPQEVTVSRVFMVLRAAYGLVATGEGRPEVLEEVDALLRALGLPTSEGRE